MATIGTARKSKKQQRQDAELGLIIDEFGRAMWNANRKYIGQIQLCQHESWIHFTPSMDAAWAKYVLFCLQNPDEKA